MEVFWILLPLASLAVPPIQKTSASEQVQPEHSGKQGEGQSVIGTYIVAFESRRRNNAIIKYYRRSLTTAGIKYWPVFFSREASLMDTRQAEVASSRSEKGLNRRLSMLK